ncbi:hypothetical protein ACTA71_009008 [Dictyostelium dimigraforme]
MESNCTEFSFPMGSETAFEHLPQQNYHIYSVRTCDILKSFSDDSSPYITFVGASQVTDVRKPEIARSVVTGAIIIGRGGVAITQSQPSYQTNAVLKVVLSHHPLHNGFYPDWSYLRNPLIGAGKQTPGFLNPLLYQATKE